MRGKFQLSKWRIGHFIPSSISCVMRKVWKLKTGSETIMLQMLQKTPLHGLYDCFNRNHKKYFSVHFFTPLTKFGRWTSILWDEVEGKEGEEGRMEDRKHWGKWESSFSRIRWAGGWGIWEITREAQKIGTIARAAARFTTGFLRLHKVKENATVK